MEKTCSLLSVKSDVLQGKVLWKDILITSNEQSSEQLFQLRSPVDSFCITPLKRKCDTKSTAEHFCAFLFLWFFQGMTKNEKWKFCHKSCISSPLPRKNLCSFPVRTIECNSYYVFLLFFSIIQCKRFFKNKTASTLVMFQCFISIYEV